MSENAWTRNFVYAPKTLCDRGILSTVDGLRAEDLPMGELARVAHSSGHRGY